MLIVYFQVVTKRKINKKHHLRMKNFLPEQGHTKYL